jgi:hypothetical protein
MLLLLLSDAMGPEESVGVEVVHSCHAGKRAAPLIINTCSTTSSSRIRPRGRKSTTTTSTMNTTNDEFPKAYRLEHTVEKTGRIISSSKKRILWYVNQVDGERANEKTKRLRYFFVLFEHSY